MSIVRKILRHVRGGTVTDVISRRMGRMAEHERVRWYGAQSEAQAARALAKWARRHVAAAGTGSWVLSLGDGSAYQQRLHRHLEGARIAFRAATLDEAAGWDPLRLQGLCAVLAAYPDTARLTVAARFFSSHPRLGNVPFESVSGLDPEGPVFARLDEYADTFFVSPVLLDNPSPYALYQESLKHFEQKCGLRDYLDLYQWLKTVVSRGVAGDIAEFGSFRGHSGWLIARTLQAFGSDKRLYMFDTFESFPVESVGVDHFWSRTHGVDFAEVQGKFRDLPRVRFVKGDFTKTLAESGLDRLALAYVDCDSYRATRFLFDRLWNDHLNAGGVLICEDYGHPALLGNRAAVHESVQGLTDCMNFFSQFSGLYVCVKLQTP